MTPETYQRLSDLFAQSSGLDGDARQQFLRDASADDPLLRKELLRLLEMDSPTGLMAADELPTPSQGNTHRQSGDVPEIEGYRVERLLGEGGMGQVWQAIQSSTRRPVALKLIHGIRFTSPQNRTRFEREVELTARLEHPNIARIFDSGFAEGYAYYAMELVPGQPLHQYIVSHQPNQKERLSLMLQICRGVQHAHQRAVIHRDLKPSNVLVTDDGRPVVVDFGLAKSLATNGDQDELLTRGVLIGTPEYMSPEQARGGSVQVDTRSDVYSLGVMLYWLLTDRLPHESRSNPLSTIQQIATEPIVSPLQAQPRMDRGLAAILAKGLAGDPNDRYSTAGDLADDLQRHLDGEPVAAAAAISRWYVLRRQLWRHRKAVAAALLILLVTLGSAIGFVVMSYRHAQVATNLANKADQARRSANTAERQALQVAYIHQLALANNESANHQPARARSLLEKCPPELRGWEWHLMWQRSAAHDRSYARTETISHRICSLAFSSDGSRIVVANGFQTKGKTEDPVIFVCDAQTGATICQLRGHTDGVYAATFTPDGRQVLAGSQDKSLRRWDAQTGELLETFTDAVPGQETSSQLVLFDIAFSPDGKRVAVAGNPLGLFLADVPEEITWQNLLAGARHVVSLIGEDDSLRFSADGQRLAWSVRQWQGNIGHVYLIDPQTTEVMQHLVRPAGEPVYSVDFDPVGSRLVTGDLRASATVYSDRLEILGRFSSPNGAVRNAYFTAKGDTVAGLAPHGQVYLWDDLTRQAKHILEAPQNRDSMKMAISPDRRRIAVATGLPSHVQLFDLESASQDTSIVAAHPPKVRDCALSPDGRSVISCGDDGVVQLRSWPDQRLIWSQRTERPHATAVAFSPDGRVVAIGSSLHPDMAPQAPFGEVRMVDAATGEPLQGPWTIPGWVWQISFDSTGERIAVADGITPAHRGRIRAGTHVIECSSGRTICSVLVDDIRCRSAAFSRDGRTLITASEQTLATWNAETGELLAKDVAVRGRNFISLHHQADQLLTGQEMAIELRRLPDLQLIKKYEQPRDALAPGQVNLIGDAVWHPSGRSLVSGSWNGTITVWDLDSTRPLLTLPAHETGVHRLLFSPDGHILLSSGHDGFVRAWRGE